MRPVPPVPPVPPVHPIESRSYAILRSRLDTTTLPPLTRAVLERVVHASADLGYATDLAISAETDLDAAAAALASGAPLVADVEMVAAGITGRGALCRLREGVAQGGRTRSADGIRRAFAEVGSGAVWVIGCAPTALEELLRLPAEPALVVGLPVGFVGAVEAKQALRDSGWPAVSNHSEKGGSAVAAAAVNALLYRTLPSGTVRA